MAPTDYFICLLFGMYSWLGCGSTEVRDSCVDKVGCHGDEHFGVGRDLSRMPEEVVGGEVVLAEQPGNTRTRREAQSVSIASSGI